MKCSWNLPTATLLAGGLVLLLGACGGGGSGGNASSVGTGNSSEVDSSASAGSAPTTPTSGNSTNTAESTAGNPGAEVGSPTEPDPVMHLTERSTTYTDDYYTRYSSSYVAVNNNWHVFACPGDAPGGQQVGVSDTRMDGSVDFQVIWDYQCTFQLIGYPEIIYGVSSSPSIAAAPGAKLPMRLGDVKRVTTRYAGVDGTANGGGYLAYDLWTSKSPDGTLTKAFRDAEILMVLYPINGFGIPRDPDGAMAGREGQQGIGWDPRGYVGRQTFDGRVYDLYYYPPGMHSEAAFITLLPLHYPKADPLEVNWKPMLDYFMAQGWLSPDVYLANVELGVETYGHNGIAKGDWTVRKYKVEVE